MFPRLLFRTTVPLAPYGRFVMAGLVRLAKLTLALTPVYSRARFTGRHSVPTITEKAALFA
jgi:hypothetical protein